MYNDEAFPKGRLFVFCLCRHNFLYYQVEIYTVYPQLHTCILSYNPEATLPPRLPRPPAQERTPPTHPTFAIGAETQSTQETYRNGFKQPDSASRKVVRNQGSCEVEPHRDEDQVGGSLEPGWCLGRHLSRDDGTCEEPLQENSESLQEEKQKWLKGLCFGELRVASERVNRATNRECDDNLDHST
jgi:hypothetical protein